MRQKLHANLEPREILWGRYWFVGGDWIQILQKKEEYNYITRRHFYFELKKVVSPANQVMSRINGWIFICTIQISIDLLNLSCQAKIFPCDAFSSFLNSWIVFYSEAEGLTDNDSSFVLIILTPYWTVQPGRPHRFKPIIKAFGPFSEMSFSELMTDWGLGRYCEYDMSRCCHLGAEHVSQTN